MKASGSLNALEKRMAEIIVFEAELKESQRNEELKRVILQAKERINRSQMFHYPFSFEGAVCSEDGCDEFVKPPICGKCSGCYRIFCRQNHLFAREGQKLKCKRCF